MKLMHKDDMIKLYVKIVNDIIDDTIASEPRIDSHAWVDLVAKKDLLEEILGIAPTKESKSNDIKINGEDDVSET